MPSLNGSAFSLNNYILGRSSRAGMPTYSLDRDCKDPKAEMLSFMAQTIALSTGAHLLNPA